MHPDEKRLLRKQNPTQALVESRGWYHSFRFSDGTEVAGAHSVELSEARYRAFPLPADLTGKTLLDIGAWDGWFSFEAERHGADVTAIDTVEVANFWTVHRKLNSHAKYRELDLFEIPQANLGTFDYVFFLGVLYHTKHPLLALEIVCGLTREMAIVESYVIDSRSWKEHTRDIPSLEFYETDELGGQMDNWFGPTVGCLIALCRAAGFARVELLSAKDNRAALACYRRWEPEPEIADQPKTVLTRVTNAMRGGINFRRSKDEYLSWWFEPAGETVREDVRLEVDGFGVLAFFAGKSASGRWVVNSRMPPYLGAGWHQARMKIVGFGWSDPVRFAIDVETWAGDLVITILCDGTSWERNAIELSRQPCVLSVWVTGLGENADEANVTLEVDGRKLRVDYVGAPEENRGRQVNGGWPRDLGAGSYQVVVRHAGKVSEPVTVGARE
jgi:tRNA (mo5U34)-methyltransferase